MIVQTAIPTAARPNRLQIGTVSPPPAWVTGVPLRFAASLLASNGTPLARYPVNRWEVAGPGVVTSDPADASSALLVATAAGVPIVVTAVFVLGGAEFRVSSAAATALAGPPVRVPSTVQVDPNPLALRVGQAQTLVVTVRDQYGEAMTGYAASAVPAAAGVVGVTGLAVTGLAVGSAAVNVTAAGITVPVPAAVAAAGSGAAIPAYPPRYTLPAGITYNAATDQTEGSVWPRASQRFGPVPGGRRVNVTTGAEFRAAMLAAQIGDNIVGPDNTPLDYTPFRMPRYANVDPTNPNSRIWVGSVSAFNGQLPAADLWTEAEPWKGMSPTSDVSKHLLLRALGANGNSGFSIGVAANSDQCGHVTFEGVYFTAVPGTPQSRRDIGDMFRIGDSSLGRITDATMMPDAIVWRNCVFDGQFEITTTATADVTNFIYWSGKRNAILGCLLKNSYSGTTSEPKGFICVQGAGPFRWSGTTWINCGMVPWMIGGSPNYVPTAPPRNWEHRYFAACHTQARYDFKMKIKNLGENKFCQEFLWEYGVVRRSYYSVQAGYGLLFKSSTTSNVDQSHVGTLNGTVRFIWIDNTLMPFSVKGRPEGGWCKGAARIHLSNILCTNTGQTGSDSATIALGASPDSEVGMPGITPSTDFAVEGVTVMLSPLNTKSRFLQIGGSGTPMPGFVFRNNVIEARPGGLEADGSGDVPRTPMLGITNLSGSDRIWETNTFLGSKTPTLWPQGSGNRYGDTRATAGFLDAAAGDFRISPTSPNAGRGCDVATLMARVAAVAAKIAGL